MYQVDNAIIMAAGTASRFAPLSYEKPKGLVTVKGEVLVERQIRQLREAGIQEIVVVTGYKKECFQYLREKYGVILINNPCYATRNNNSSIYAAKEYLKNSYICSSDNYFPENPFESQVDCSYYAAVHAQGDTGEWCLQEDENGYITEVTVGGSNAWYMLGHVFFDETFSRKFLKILEKEYDLPETGDKFWEDLFIEHIGELKMKARHYQEKSIFEFDSLDELRQFDRSYVEDTRSEILKKIARELNCREGEIVNIKTVKAFDNRASGCTFLAKGLPYEYDYASSNLRRI